METEAFTSAWAGSSLGYGRRSGVSYRQTRERAGESQGGLCESGDTGSAVRERLPLQRPIPSPSPAASGLGTAKPLRSKAAALPPRAFLVRVRAEKPEGCLVSSPRVMAPLGRRGELPPGSPHRSPRLSPCRCRRVRGGHRQLPHRRHLPEHPQVLQVHLQVWLHRRREALQR